jgi:transcriptional/translational regulatory protein YebC/TACO1
MSDIKVMRVSAINNLPSRLTFLAKMLQSEHQANTEPLYIESYRIHDENVIRLSTKNGIYTEINPYDKEEGEILKKKLIEKLEEDEDVQNVFHNMKEDENGDEE